MNFPELHRHLLHDLLEVGRDFPLVITGGYAVQAHGLVTRASRDLDVATQNPMAMNAIVAAVSAGLTARSWTVRQVETDPLAARLIVADKEGQECEVDILKEAFWLPPLQTDYGPVLALEDVIGTKVRALVDRGAVRDLIDAYAISQIRTNLEMETLGRRHARDDFRLEDMAMRLGAAELYEDDSFAVYGVTGDELHAIRAWAAAWCDDIQRRLCQDEFDPGES
jgi:predicted nucleotidyltransferase component of viral defense system